MDFSVLEVCAGAGGQAIGLEGAGFQVAAAIDIDPDACVTLRRNRPNWTVIEGDIREFGGSAFRGIDLLAGGVPCPPFSIAGKQLGTQDERDLFPEAIRLVREIKPAAVMLENVPGFSMARFAEYRSRLMQQLDDLGYDPDWKLLNACWFGVPQLRPRFILIGVGKKYSGAFQWPQANGMPRTVGECIGDLMACRGWKGAKGWQQKAARIAPTIVGGSKKHGGPDLGPTRAKRQWALLGVDGHGIADAPPDQNFPRERNPRLTVSMVARLQGIPDEWIICGGKTSAYRQVGNALPPPVAQAVGQAIADALAGKAVYARRLAQTTLFARDHNGTRYSSRDRIRLQKAGTEIPARKSRKSPNISPNQTCFGGRL